MLINKQDQQNKKCKCGAFAVFAILLLAQIFLCDVLAANANSIPKHLDCPAGKIALASQKAAIEAEMKRIEDMANESQDFSDDLGKCLGGLSVSIKIPTFPSIDDILGKIKDKACQVARDQIDGHIRGKLPSSIDPWKYATDQISDSKYGEYLPSTGNKSININTKDKFKDDSSFPWSL
ncbi:hypothetical protein [Photorhabdus asymbiotica]|uniref:hypothetical protein n=1 Tax=Photorhabdus asymbiotica TaxID=291112 RepID=UPI003DA7915B